MPFTDDEIQTAVENLVRATIRRPYDTLGVRRTDVSFSDTQEAASGVFLLYPKSPFYCIYLGAQRALEAVASEAAGIELLLAAIKAVSRHVLPITDITPIFNAQAALSELGSAVSQRTTGFADITAVPAYQRFSDNVNRFLSSCRRLLSVDGLKSACQVASCC